MTRRCHSSPPHPLPSCTRRCRQCINDADLDDDVSLIPNNYYDSRDTNSESNSQPLWRPSQKAMGKKLLKDSIPSTLGKRGVATQLTSMSVWSLHTDSRKIYIFSDEEDEPDIAQLASKKIFDYVFEWFNVPANGQIYWRNESNEASEDLVTRKARNLLQYHQEKTIPSGRNGSIRVDAFRQSGQRRPGGGLLYSWRQYHASHCILPSHCRLTVSSRAVGLLFQTNTLALKAHCNYTSKWVCWACTCIGIAMQWFTLRKPLLAFLLYARKMKFSHY